MGTVFPLQSYRVILDSMGSLTLSPESFLSVSNVGCDVKLIGHASSVQSAGGLRVGFSSADMMKIENRVWGREML